MGTDIWSLFPSSIVRFIEALLRDGRIGICAGTIRIIDVGSSCSSLTDPPCADRLKILIPYAGQSIAWEILFNYHQPEEPPDFIFGADNDDFVIDIEQIPSLVNWDSRDSYALLHAVRQLLEQYKIYQKSLIDQSSRLQFEYNSLIDQGNFKPDDIEIHASIKSHNRIGTVNFLIKLPIDFSKIPAYLTKDNPGEDTAVLVVTFQSPDGVKIVPQLFLSPRVEYSLGGSANLRIPTFPSGGCLIDYVPDVCEMLQNKVEQVIQGYEKRKKYISQFLSNFGKSVVEYDSEAFQRISFLHEWHDFFFVVTIDLPALFPVEQPVFTFQSVYHEAVDGQPFSKAVKDYPYSPRWSSKEMADRARTYILDNIGTFQRTSVADGSL